MGWIWYSQSRVTRARRIAKWKIFIDAQLVPSFLRSLLGGAAAAERPLWSLKLHSMLRERSGFLRSKHHHNFYVRSMWLRTGVVEIVCKYG